MINLVKIFLLLFITSCGETGFIHNQSVPLKDQEKIAYIQHKCQKYQIGKNLTRCIANAKKSFSCIKNVDQYLSKTKLKQRLSCLKESIKQFPYKEKRSNNQNLLKEEDIDKIYENMNYFLGKDEILIDHYKEKEYDNSKEKFKIKAKIYKSRQEFAKKCEEKSQNQIIYLKEKYLTNCEIKNKSHELFKSSDIEKKRIELHHFFRPPFFKQ